MIGNRTADRGQFFHHLLEGFARHGICSEERMPYEAAFRATEPTDEARAEAEAIRALGFEVHWIKRWGTGAGVSPEELDRVRRALDAGWPVAAGASHSTLIVAYQDDESAPGGGRFVVADSGAGAYRERTYEFVRTKVNDVFYVEPPAAKGR